MCRNRSYASTVILLGPKLLAHELKTLVYDFLLSMLPPVVAYVRETVVIDHGVKTIAIHGLGKETYCETCTALATSRRATDASDERTYRQRLHSGPNILSVV